MSPDHQSSLRWSRWFEQMSPADFFVSFRRHLRQDQVTLLAEEYVTIFMANDERIAPACRLLAGRFKRGPLAITILDIQASGFSVAANAVDVIAINDRSTHQTVQRIGILFIFAVTLPDDGRLWLRLIEFQQQRPVVEGTDKQVVTADSWCRNAQALC